MFVDIKVLVDRGRNLFAAIFCGDIEQQGIQGVPVRFICLVRRDIIIFIPQRHRIQLQTADNRITPLGYDSLDFIR